MGKQLELFPELDLNSKEPIQYDHGSGQFINKFKEVPVRKPNAVPPKTKTIQKYKDGSKPKFREENLNERLERIMYENGESNIKPKHYDNPFIVDSENFKKPPAKYDSQDDSTFPSNRSQKQKMMTWDLMLESAKGNPKEMKDVREILNKSYKSNPDLLTDQELKMIGKYKSKNKVELPEIPKPIINIPEPTPPPKPTKPLSQIIKEGADERLKEEQRIYDERFGKGGITKLFRPE